MKILHILPTLNKSYGGPVVVVENITVELRKCGIQVDILPIDENNIYTFTLKLLRIVKEYDVVHVHGIWNLQHTIAMFITRTVRVPYVVTPHGMLDNWSLRQGFIKKYFYFLVFEKGNLKSARYIHFLNSGEVKESQDFFNFSTYKIIPNGADISLKSEVLSKFKPLFERLRRENYVFLLYLGRLHPKKGLDDLLAAFSLVLKTNPNFFMVIAGGGSELYFKNLVRASQSFSLEDNIEFLGPVYGDDKTYLFQQSDVFLLPSYQEGDSVAVKEAMSFRLPVIVTKACHFDEVKRHDAGIVVKNDVGEIANSVLFFADEKVRKVYGNNAGNLIKEKYTWDIIANEYVKMYTACLK